VPIKQTAMVSAVERHLLVDASKFGQVRAVGFAQISLRKANSGEVRSYGQANEADGR
jgi:hypothetical protein